MFFSRGGNDLDFKEGPGPEGGVLQHGHRGGELPLVRPPDSRQSTRHKTIPKKRGGKLTFIPSQYRAHGTNNTPPPPSHGPGGHL